MNVPDSVRNYVLKKYILFFLRGSYGDSHGDQKGTDPLIEGIFRESLNFNGAMMAPSRFVLGQNYC